MSARTRMFALLFAGFVLVASITVTANLGTVTAGSITGVDITGTTITGTTITGGSIDGAYISGSTLEAGGGTVVLDSAGIEIASGSADVNRLKWSDGSYLYSTSGHVQMSSGSFTFVESGGPSVLGFAGGALYPHTNGAVNLGATSNRFGALHLSGTVTNSAWTDTGNRYLCVAPDGTIFVWPGPCV